MQITILSLRCCLAWFLLALPACLLAQNWAPLNLNDQFNYQVDTADLITEVIFPDSVSLNGSDSVFHLNRIVADCPSCGQGFMIANQPQFLMRKAILQGAGLWNFKDTSNIALYTLAAQGFSWRFDSLALIDATVDSIFTDSLFGLADSTKRILLSSGDTILLSANHGILQWPQHYGTGIYHRLVGIKGQNLGTLLPGFAGFFDYHVGDVLQFNHFRYQCPAGPCSCSTQSLAHKITLDSIEVVGNDHIYSFHGLSKSFSGFGCSSSGGVGQASGTFTIRDSSDHLANHYPNQLITAEKRMHNFLERVGGISSYPIGDMVPDLYDRVNYRRDANGRIQIKSSSPEAYYDFAASNSYVLRPYGFSQDAILMIEGIGLWKYEFVNFEAGGSWIMEGYFDGTDTLGRIDTDSAFSSIVIGIDNPTDANISLFPNPSEGIITLSWDNTSFLGEGRLQIFAMDGRIVASFELNAEQNGKMRLDLSDLPNGIYIWRMQTDEQVLDSGKLVLAR